MDRNFMQLAEAKWKQGKNVCMGLDIDRLKVLGSTMEIYGRRVIDETVSFVGGYKINTAMYEAEGPRGLRVLRNLVDYIFEQDGQMPVIIDAKRTDIGNTNKYYVRALQNMGADAVTVNPYFGGESLAPFFNERDLGVFVLCRTSNPGASEFQDMDVNGKPLYMHVAQSFTGKWNTNGNCGLVVGATYPSELELIRWHYPNVPLLIPGIGTQGGDLEATVKAARHRMFINAGSSVLYAPHVGDAARAMHEQVLSFLH